MDETVVSANQNHDTSSGIGQFRVGHFNLAIDPMMLFSFINMKLRDNYSSLDELCDDMHLQKEMLVQKLKSAGFEYSQENNKFW